MTLTVSLDKSGSGDLALTLPNGSTITLAADHKVGPLLAELLFAQQEATSHGRPHGLGTASSPTQGMIDDFLFRGGKINRIEPVGKRKPPPSGWADVTLESLGLVPK